MSKIIWSELYNEMILNPLLEVKRFLLDIKSLFRTIGVTISNPIKINFDKNGDNRYLTAAKSSSVLMKFLFLLITIKLLLSFDKSSDDSFDLIAEYLIFFGYVLSLIVILSYSYIFNLLGNLKIDKTGITSSSLVYMFNVIYSLIILFSLLNLDITISYDWIFGLGIPFTIYYIIRLSMKLKYSIVSTIINCSLTTIIIGGLIFSNYILLTLFYFKDS